LPGSGIEGEQEIRGDSGIAEGTAVGEYVVTGHRDGDAHDRQGQEMAGSRTSPLADATVVVVLIMGG